MVNKYYTPQIEEFYVGFEYEKKEIVSKGSFLEEDWVDKKCDVYELYEISRHYTEDGIFGKEDYRVKFLDREDIESLGWDLDSVVEKECFYIHKSSNFINQDTRLVFIEKENTIEILCEKTLFSFYGIIKNKSVLKNLMVQFNISIDGK